MLEKLTAGFNYGPTLSLNGFFHGNKSGLDDYRGEYRNRVNSQNGKKNAKE